MMVSNTRRPKAAVRCGSCGWKGVRAREGRPCPRCKYYFPRRAVFGPAPVEALQADRFIDEQIDALTCDHKFVDSNRCLKCGWIPRKE